MTGSGGRCRRFKRGFRSKSAKCPRGRRSSTGPCRKEWNIRDAWIKDPDGQKVVDFQRSNLHVLNYSSPVKAVLPLSEVRPHLFTLPEHPDWIPYRTSYYQENWGFCLSHNQLLGLEDGDYEVCIESSLEDGHLTYGECYLPWPVRGRGVDLLPCLSSVAGERQSVRA